MALRPVAEFPGLADESTIKPSGGRLETVLGKLLHSKELNYG